MVRSRRVISNCKKIATRSQNSSIQNQPEFIDLACGRSGAPEIITLDSTNRQRKSQICNVIDLEDDDVSVLATRRSDLKRKIPQKNACSKEVVIDEDHNAGTSSQSLRQIKTNEKSIAPFGKELSDVEILVDPERPKFPDILPKASTTNDDSSSWCLMVRPPLEVVPKNLANVNDCVLPSRTDTISEPCSSGDPSPNFVPYKRSFNLPCADEIKRIEGMSSVLPAVSDEPFVNASSVWNNVASSSNAVKARGKANQRSVKQITTPGDAPNRRYALRSKGPPIAASRKSPPKKNMETEKLEHGKHGVASKGKKKLESAVGSNLNGRESSDVWRKPSHVFPSNAIVVECKTERCVGSEGVADAESNGKTKVAEQRASLKGKQGRGRMSNESSAEQELDFIPIPHIPRRKENELSGIFNRKKRAFRVAKNSTNSDARECRDVKESLIEACAPKSRRELKRLNRVAARKMIGEKRKRKASKEFEKATLKNLKGLKASRKVNPREKGDSNKLGMFGKKQCLDPGFLKKRKKIKQKLRKKERLSQKLNKQNTHVESQNQEPFSPKFKNLPNSRSSFKGRNLNHSTPFDKKLTRRSNSSRFSKSFSDFNWITLDACHTDIDQLSDVSEDFDLSGPSCSNTSRAKVTKHWRESRCRSESEESCQEVPMSRGTETDEDIIADDDGKLSSDDGANDLAVADDAISLSSEEFNLKEHAHDDAASVSSEESFSIDIGSNVYVPGGVSFTGRRPIIIDGSNVAVAHGISTRGQRVFSSRGLEICAKFFIKRGHKVIVFVPLFRRSNRKTLNPEILEKMSKRGLITYTPSRKLKRTLSIPYDDRYIVQCAVALGGVIVSTDNYKDLLKENRTWKSTIEKRLLMFTFVGDMLMFPQDPLGRRGPKLDDFLMFPR